MAGSADKAKTFKGAIGLSWGNGNKHIDVLQVRGGRHAPAAISDAPLISFLDGAFREVVDSSLRLRRVLGHLEEAGARYCIFGGWLRDTCASLVRGTAKPRDVDIVVQRMDVSGLLTLLPPDVKPTIFGGIQSSAAPIPFDLWPLHETFLIKRLALPASFTSLLWTADFNINAALYFPAQQGMQSSVLDAGMLSALHEQTIAFNASELPFPVLQCARLAAYSAKLRFQLSGPVSEFMRDVLANQDNYIEVIAGLRKYHVAEIAEGAIQIVQGLNRGYT